MGLRNGMERLGEYTVAQLTKGLPFMRDDCKLEENAAWRETVFKVIKEGTAAAATFEGRTCLAASTAVACLGGCSGVGLQRDGM